MQSDIGHPCWDQLTAVKTGYPLTSIAWPYRGLRYRPIEVGYFLKLSADKLLVFKWSQAQEISCVYEPHLSRTNKSLISNWPRTRKFSQEGNYFWLTMVTRWPPSTSNFYVLIGQIWQASSCGKFMQHLETSLLIVEADRVLCRLVMFLTVFFHWM